jgi:DNA-directed RNA polymerase specialized sigma54-like protein
MQLNQRLNIKHSQSIVMTPQLRQAIKLLQFSNLELSSYIDEEIEKNPFLQKFTLQDFLSYFFYKKNILQQKCSQIFFGTEQGYDKYCRYQHMRI